MLFTFTREVCHANCSRFAHAPWFLGVVALGVHRPDASWLLGMVAAWPRHSRLHHLEFANGMLESLRRWPLSQRGPLGPIHGPLAVKDGAHAGQNGSRARTHGAWRRRLVGTSPDRVATVRSTITVPKRCGASRTSSANSRSFWTGCVLPRIGPSSISSWPSAATDPRTNLVTKDRRCRRQAESRN